MVAGPDEREVWGIALRRVSGIANMSRSHNERAPGNEALVEHLIESGALKTPALIDAFYAIDRADFVRPEYAHEVYGDYPLPIGGGGTISQPSTVAFMLELLAPARGDTILDVGSGSGWTTALLVHVVGAKGRVWGVEIVPELVKFGQENLTKYDVPQAHIVAVRDNTLGLPKRGPFDKILVSAAAQELSDELIAQLKPGGRLVIPINNSVWKIEKRPDGSIKQKEFSGFVFVPLIT